MGSRQQQLLIKQTMQALLLAVHKLNLMMQHYKELWSDN